MTASSNEEMSNVYPGHVPSGLINTEFVLRPIVAADAAKDHAAVMETRESLRLWEQSSWPDDDFTVEANREDLVNLEKRHGDRRAFTFTVVSPDGSECLGCVYVFPPGASFLAKSDVTAVGHDRWADVDVVVYFWARRTQMETGIDERLFDALRVWFRDDWKVATAVFVTNTEFTQQVDLIRRSDLTLKFELVEPGKRGKYLAFG
ncbi:GNAT family N-acetyltransferase [Leifsonia poae]|uniref:GNAT family N-acetyltransferase n=1 Tax=Leifsonia poae TaxID=110933 RepID=UPI003D675E63